MEVFNYILSENIHKKNIYQNKFLLIPFSSVIRHLIAILEVLQYPLHPKGSMETPIIVI